MSTANEPAITIVGHVCIDHNRVDGSYHEAWGSAALYIEEYLRKVHNIRAKIIAPHGKDIMSFIDVEFVNRPLTSPTLIYENTIVSGARTQAVMHYESAEPVPVTNAVRRVLASTDVLLLAPLLPHFSPNYIRQICEYLPAHAQKILLPQGYYRAIGDAGQIHSRDFIEVSEILQRIDVLVQSDEDSTDALQTVEGWARNHSGLTAVVTQNRNGATVFSNDDSFSLPTTPIAPKSIVNPVGAGDVFSAELAYSLHNSPSLHVALMNAQAAALKHISGQ